MAFVRKVRIGRKTYHYVVESVRKGNQVSQNILVYLGNFASVESVYKAASEIQEQLRDARKLRRRESELRSTLKRFEHRKRLKISTQEDEKQAAEHHQELATIASRLTLDVADLEAESVRLAQIVSQLDGIKEKLSKPKKRKSLRRV